MPDGGLDGDKWLREHSLCTLATGRRDGSPQQTLVSYHYDGNDIIISTCSDRPKWMNSKRQPRVSLLVQDGRQYTVVYGQAQHVESDPERLELTKRVGGWKRRVDKYHGDEQAALRELNEEKRTILRVVPDKIVPHS